MIFITGNNFIANREHAIDESGDNQFNSTKIGNYWDDYHGSDENDNGIGDTPYTIPGEGNSKDFKPSIEPFPRKKGENNWLWIIGLVGSIITAITIGFVWYYKKQKATKP